MESVQLQSKSLFLWHFVYILFLLFRPNTKAPTTNMPTTQQPKAETTQPPTTTHPPTTTTTTQQPTQPVTSPTFHRARNRLSPTTIQPQSIVDQMKDGLSEQMHKGLAQVNTAPRFAYVLIMIVSLITLGLLLIGFCCCIRCNLIADVRVAQVCITFTFIYMYIEIFRSRWMLH